MIVSTWLEVPMPDDWAILCKTVGTPENGRFGSFPDGLDDEEDQAIADEEDQAIADEEDQAIADEEDDDSDEFLTEFLERCPTCGSVDISRNPRDPDDCQCDRCGREWMESSYVR